MRDGALSDSCFSHIVNAPIERVDIADWLFRLTCAEYRRCCPPAHIAAGTSAAPDGRRMSIQAEVIADSLLIHQFIAEITNPHHCRMASSSEMFSPRARTTSQLVWDVSVEPLDTESCELINRITATATDESLAQFGRHGIPLEHPSVVNEAYATHNEQETPGLAESIERHALASGEHPTRPPSLD
jgi:hypothetical protein